LPLVIHLEQGRWAVKGQHAITKTL
jgi:hypothetical protein